MQQLFVGRQAIFDRRMRVRGYELLYREANGGFVSGMDGNKASASVILNAFIEMGVSRITGNQPAFLNLTRDFFTEMPPLPFDKKKMVLEILEVSMANKFDPLSANKIDPLGATKNQLSRLCFSR